MKCFKLSVLTVAICVGAIVTGTTQQAVAQTGAAKAIEHALRKNWSDDLVKRYGELDFASPQRQLLSAESWIQDRPGNAELLLALGRIAMRNELWGKAKEYFETSIDVAASAEAHGELSRLLKCLGEGDLADEHQQKFVSGMGAELPQLPMPVALSKEH